MVLGKEPVSSPLEASVFFSVKWGYAKSMSSEYKAAGTKPHA